MSFLAQLRQQQSINTSALRLCYLFEFQAYDVAVKLRLALADLSQPLLSEPNKPYRIQQQHLQHPPPFMDSQDVSVINQLIAESSEWLDQSQGGFPASQAEISLSMLLETGRCFLIKPGGQWQKIISSDPVAVSLQWLPDNRGDYHLKWRVEGEWKIRALDNDGVYTLAYDMNRGLVATTQQAVSLDALNELKQSLRSLTVAEIPGFLVDHAKRWRSLGLPLPVVTDICKQAATICPVLRLYSGASDNIGNRIRHSISLLFRYSSEIYSTAVEYSAQEENHDFWDGVKLNRIYRDFKQEEDFYQALGPFLDQFDQSRQSGIWCSDLDSNWRDLLIGSRFELSQHGFKFLIDSNFRYYYVAADGWNLEIEDADQDNLSIRLQLELLGGDIDLLSVLADLRTYNANQNDNYFALNLDDGRTLLLPAHSVNGIMQELGDLLAIQGSGLRIPMSQVSRLAELNQHLPESTRCRGEVEHLDHAISLHQAPKLLQQIIDGVDAELRPYQWLGVCWLQHLRQHGANGLLADDMGLGKTLQTLVHVNLEQQNGRLQQPALIVVPTSLLHTWASEIRLFTPHLRYQIVHGANRGRLWGAALQKNDLLITSYPLIVKDLDQWKAQKLSWLILDEAHQIKNFRTQISRALRQIDSDHRLCLSGTPVQNHLGELWSILDFLMPGCLGNYASFRQYYQRPIELEADENRLAQLQKRIAPFMLRRTKDQVAADLPIKTEICQTISLNEDQRQFYNDQKTSAQGSLQMQLSDTNNNGQHQILLLTALLKLRQTCCDPALLGVPTISSAKRTHCIQMVEELVAEERVILIFSQFTRMLDRLEDDLQNIGIKTLKLTGQSKNRQDLIASFQRGDAPVFLISLKAGGVGLNLTRADTVIHYDPWWNLAAEQQASDRAHRIGQDKPVFVYRLICENTIEDKIAQMQQQKAQISHHINHQAQISGQQFALKLEDLLALWQEEYSAS
ncbi:MAG: superfamily II DNA or RNA helicase [Gammaproteobacteria bacterium]|jgi:superfamily II DNA or RNA helicase